MRDLDAGDLRIYLEFEYRRLYCPSCDAVKRETLAWLARSARFTQRFEDRIGQLCREIVNRHLILTPFGHRKMTPTCS